MNNNIDKNSFIVKKRIGFLLFTRDFLLTLTLWTLWIYLLYPLFGIFVWKFFALNIFFYYDSIDQIKQLELSLKEFLVFSDIVVGLIVFTVLGWGYYNQKKYAFFKNQRRKVPKPITSEMLAKTLHTKPQIIDALKEAQYVQFYHTDKSPEDPKKVFTPIALDKDIKRVNMIFSDDWNKIRETSNFSYTHLQQSGNIDFQMQVLNKS